MSSKHPSILSLQSHLSSPVFVTLSTEITVTGTLLGYDELVNLVLKDAVFTGSSGVEKELGLVVIRGTQVVSVEGGGRVQVDDPFKEGEEVEVEA